MQTDPPQSRVRSVGGVVRDLGATGAAVLASTAGSYQQVVSRLSRAYPQLRAAGQLYAAASEVWSRAPAAGAAGVAGASASFGRGVESVRPGQHPEYRYTASVSWQDQQTGRTVSGYVILDSDRALSPGEAMARISDNVELAGADSPTFGAEPPEPDDTTLRIVIIAATSRQ